MSTAPLELNIYAEAAQYEDWAKAVAQKLHDVDDERILILAEALRRGFSIQWIYDITRIDHFFLKKIKNLVDMEEMLMQQTMTTLTEEILLKAKIMGFTDSVIAAFTGCKKHEITRTQEWNITAAYKTVDTCASEIETATPYYYSI